MKKKETITKETNDDFMFDMPHYCIWCGDRMGEMQLNKHPKKCIFFKEIIRAHKQEAK